MRQLRSWCIWVRLVEAALGQLARQLLLPYNQETGCWETLRRRAAKVKGFRENITVTGAAIGTNRAGTITVQNRIT
jgi:hypothetical protein